MPPSDPENAVHMKWMARCIELAGRGFGLVSPNPLVGCVLVGENDELLGEGWHQSYGGPHAERNAIEAAESRHGSEALKKATLYVNLEPCSHFGKTPPCSHLIVEKEIPRVVIGMIDPNEQVSGRGIDLLRRKGVEVCVGVLQTRCERLNEAFSHYMATGRPLVSLKIAQTLDGRVATSSGDSRWITGKDARTLVHQWRSQLDAVLVGRATALVDDPSLSVRHASGRHPYRVVLDRSGSLPPTLRLFSDDLVEKTIAVVAPSTDPPYRAQLEAAGGSLLHVDASNGRLDLYEVLKALGTPTYARRGFQSVLVEAGPALATAFLERDLVDRFYLFIAPRLIGRGVPAFDGLSIEKMSEALSFAESHWRQIGDDMLFEGYRRRF